GGHRGGLRRAGATPGAAGAAATGGDRRAGAPDRRRGRGGRAGRQARHRPGQPTGRGVLSHPAHGGGRDPVRPLPAFILFSFGTGPGKGAPRPRRSRPDPHAGTGKQAPNAFTSSSHGSGRGFRRPSGVTAVKPKRSVSIREIAPIVRATSTRPLNWRVLPAT